MGRVARAAVTAIVLSALVMAALFGYGYTLPETHRAEVQSIVKGVAQDVCEAVAACFSFQAQPTSIRGGVEIDE